MCAEKYSRTRGRKSARRRFRRHDVIQLTQPKRAGTLRTRTTWPSTLHHRERSGYIGDQRYSTGLCAFGEGAFFARIAFSSSTAKCLGNRSNLHNASCIVRRSISISGLLSSWPTCERVRGWHPENCDGFFRVPGHHHHSPGSWLHGPVRCFIVDRPDSPMLKLAISVEVGRANRIRGDQLRVPRESGSGADASRPCSSARRRETFPSCPEWWKLNPIPRGRPRKP